MKSIIEAVENNKSVKMIIFSLNHTSEERIKKVLSLFLNNNGCGTLIEPVYICVKELLINAVRANYKVIFFDSSDTSEAVQNSLSHETEMQLFNMEMLQGSARNLVRIARNNNIGAELQIEFHEGILKITVSNPVAMQKSKLNAVIKRIYNSHNSKDISHFFSEYPEENEEEGVGLIIITMIMKSLGMKQPALSIKSHGGSTTAEMEIPLNRNIVYNYNRATQTPPGM